MTKLLSTLAVGLLATSAMAQACFEAVGSPIGIFADSISAPQPIGFAFPFAGSTYNEISISDHGICWLAASGLLYSPLAADLALNGPVLCPFWTDTVPGAIGDVYVGGTATQYTITWQDMINFGGTQTFTFQMTLYITGEIKCVYDANVTNNSTFGGISANGIIGCSPGSGALIPASSDFSAGPVTADDTTYEEFLTAMSFDMAADGFNMVPINPGFVVIPLGGATSCATATTYGTGCGGGPGHIYELIPTGTFDLNGTTISLLRGANGYTALDAIPGTFIAPSASAAVVALGDDIEETVALSMAMPIPGGTTTDLTISSNGQITLAATGNGNGWTPDVPTWLGSALPMISPMWHDFQPNAAGSGTISFEEVNGVAIVSWNDVWNWSFTNGETFQVQFDLLTGNITIVYDAITNNVGTDYLVGFTSGGNMTDTGGNDLSVDLAGTLTFNDMEILPLTLASNRPVLGTNWDLTTSSIDAASPIAITFLGNGQGPGLPFSAIGLNAPGCSIWINTILGSLTGVATSGSATVSLPIPTNPALAGAILTGQSICLTLQNQANLLGSNGIEGTLGF